MFGPLASWWNDRPLGTKGIVVVALPLTALSLITTLSLASLRAADRAATEFTQAAGAASAADDLMHDVLLAENAVGGYLLTGDEVFLEPYEQVLADLPEDQARLEAALASEPEHDDRAALLFLELDNRMGILGQLVALGSPEGRALDLMLEGRRVMDGLRATINTIERVEEADVVEAEDDRRAAAARAEAAALVGIAAGVLGGVLAAVVFARSIARRVRRNQENAERLIAGGELLPPPGGRDEVGRSGSALVEAAHMLAERDRALTRSEAEQREQRELLQAILDQMGEGVVVADEAGTFVMFNPAAESILGMGPTNASPAEWSERYGLFSEDGAEVPATELPLARALRGESTDDVVMFVRNASRPEGAYVNASGRPLRDPTGSGRGGLIVFRDITRSRQNELRLDEYRHDLERSNQELERFAYVASHDLQEPLRMVASHVQLLAGDLKGTLGPDQVESMDFAVDGAKRMQQLINDLLTYSRVGRRGKPFEPTPMDDVLDTALVNLEIAVREHGAEVTHDELPELNVDAGQMTQLLQNLIANAVKFHGEESPRVHVCAEPAGEDWVFTVEDNGIGIPPEQVERVFQIFQRLHSRAEYEGTGIGLAVCRRIVERHGGRIWVEPRSPQGSRFRFTIPAAANEVAA